MTKRLLVAASLALALAACNDQYAGSTRHLSPIPPSTMSLMAAKGMSKSDPILIRAYKKESELEVWKKGSDGQYALLKSYPICRWSGQLGPKRKEGDRQAPEGFYTVTPAQMNPNSSFYLSFDTGYPNAYDRSHGGTGAQLMVHGTCSSRGCFAMTDEGIAEVYAIARESFASGQRGFQFQSYPFRMTAENLARHRYDPNMPFWKNLKEGADAFEVTKAEPTVGVCNGRYAFNAPGCKPDPQVAALVKEKEQKDEQEVAELVSKGTPAVKLVYEDGSGHKSFQQTAAVSTEFAVLDSRPRRLGEVSRPDALARGPSEIAMDAPNRPVRESKPTALAYAPTHEVRSAKAATTVAAAPTAVTPAAKVAAKSSPKPGTPEPAQVASAAPAASEPATEDKPFYKRAYDSVFSSKRDAVPETQAAEAAKPAAPTPPARKSSSKPTPERRADLQQPRT